MSLPHPSITVIPTVPLQAAVPALWNERYIEINENFAAVETEIETEVEKLKSMSFFMSFAF